NNVLGIVVNAARRGELYSKYTYYHSYYTAKDEEEGAPDEDFPKADSFRASAPSSEDSRRENAVKPPTLPAATTGWGGPLAPPPVSESGQGASRPSSSRMSHRQPENHDDDDGSYEV